jgi:hypothetical protein
MKTILQQGMIRGLVKPALALAALLALLVPTQGAWAAASVCRSDPVVTLSNGVTVTMQEDIAADPSAVQSISYTLNAPRGTTITSITYYGPIPPEQQVVTLVSNQDATHYHSSTSVKASSNSIKVTATLTVGSHSVSGTGNANSYVNLGVNNQ